MEKMIAACGLDCAKCNAYLATKDDDQALREKTAAEWSAKFNINCTPDMINCTGCKGDGVKIGSWSNCPMHTCAPAKGVANCGACVEFKTCKDLAFHIALHKDLYDTEH